jgi:DNA-binding NtrC family response regulator
VPFGADALAMLGRRGFSAEEAKRFFGIFFQLRRAFHFIVQELIGESDCMKALRRHLWDNVFTHDIRWYDRYLWNRMEDFSTLLLGETGTGKGTAAAAIGRSGFIPFDERKGCFAESFTRGFVSLNLSQYPETLIESELFGHRKGAFTGAVEAHEGVLARCSPHGAIFLDEIGDVSTPVQIKLLQVLQERTFSPVGSHEKRRFRGRVIAATNQPVDALRDKKVFRDDFFYRLCSDVITVPQLRRRIEEQPAELEHLVKHLVTRMTGGEAPNLVTLVLDALRVRVGPRYAWPGNVRELEQAVRRILVTGRYDGDTRGVAPDLRSRLSAGLDQGSLDADTLLAGYCALLRERHCTIEEVARRTNLDRRTVKRYLAMERRT